MWWIIALGIVAGAVVVVYVLTRTTKGERRRSTNWNNLHTRGRLFTTQLAHLREVETRHGAVDAAKVPHGKSATKAGFLWRRHAPVPQEAGGAPPESVPPE